MTTYSYTATLTSPLHHGAGTAGNTALLRVQTVLRPGGHVARVPFVSANSIRHSLRSALAWHTVQVLGIPDGSLSKPAVDLLWSGGAVTKTGAETDLQLIRDIDTYLPWLAMLGYAAKSDIIAGTLRVSDAILACTENDFRLPASLTDLRPAAHYRGEEFGTRHDADTSAASRMIHLSSDHVGTTQMIYDLQVLNPGARLWGTIELDGFATDTHRVALDVALELWAPGGKGTFGAKSAVGYGAADIVFEGDARQVAAYDTLTEHLASHRDTIVDLIGRATS